MVDRGGRGLMAKSGLSTRRTGFTIVELLIVIVVIGILAAISIVAFNGVQARSRDARRVSDLNNIAKALEAQFAINGEYPNTVASGVGGTTTCLSAPGWGCWGFTDATRFIDKQYMPIMPQDPSFLDNNACGYPNNDLTRAYWYDITVDRKGYLLGTYMEAVSTSDPRYDNGSVNRGCGNFINWAIKRNWPN
jgi:prepilin-type N-terminal cleavage/methylation domain-containing protein